MKIQTANIHQNFKQHKYAPVFHNTFHTTGEQIRYKFDMVFQPTTRWREIPTWRSSGEPGLLDEGNHFDESTGRFTAPSSGYYHVSANVRMDAHLGLLLNILNLWPRQLDNSLTNSDSCGQSPKEWRNSFGDSKFLYKNGGSHWWISYIWEWLACPSPWTSEFILLQQLIRLVVFKFDVFFGCFLAMRKKTFPKVDEFCGYKNTGVCRFRDGNEHCRNLWRLRYFYRRLF